MARHETDFTTHLLVVKTMAVDREDLGTYVGETSVDYIVIEKTANMLVNHKG